MDRGFDTVELEPVEDKMFSLTVNKALNKWLDSNKDKSIVQFIYAVRPGKYRNVAVIIIYWESKK